MPRQCIWFARYNCRLAKTSVPICSALLVNADDYQYTSAAAKPLCLFCSVGLILPEKTAQEIGRIPAKDSPILTRRNQRCSHSSSTGDKLGPVRFGSCFSL